MYMVHHKVFCMTLRLLLCICVNHSHCVSVTLANRFNAILVSGILLRVCNAFVLQVPLNSLSSEPIC